MGLFDGGGGGLNIGGLGGAISGGLTSSGLFGTLAGGAVGQQLGGALGLPGINLGNMFSGMYANMPGANLMQGVTPEQAKQLYDQQQAALAQQQGFANAVNSAYSGLPAQQMALAQQLQQQAAGGGPNPALNQLAQTTGQNVANQAALMAGQRGSGANAGMMARQIAHQGAATQQQATGQAATMRAQQQLAAQQALMQQQNAMMGQQQNAMGANLSGIQGAQGNVLGGIGNWNATQAGLSGQAAQLASQNAGVNRGIFGGILGAAGSALGMPGMFGGGGGGGGASSGVNPKTADQYMMAGGGEVGPRSHFGRTLAGMNMKSGGAVPGQAAVAGDSYKNDTVQAMLSPGEIVIPRSVAQSSNAPDKAAEFVAAVLARKGKK